MFTRILIAIDGSDSASRAAKFGLELAERYDARADLVHVSTAGTAEEADTNAASVFEGVDAFDIDADIERHRLDGTPPKRLARAVEEFDSDLVVMGRRGRAGLGKRLLGSTTERILRTVGVPVLAVPAGDVTEATGRSMSDVLLTTDGSDVAELAAPYGASVARQYDGQLHLLTVVDVQAEAGVFDAGGVDREYIERLEAEGEEGLKRLREAADADDLDVRSEVVRGEAHEGIADYAEANEIDLLALSSEGKSNLVKQRLGSVANRVLRTASVPVLVVPVTD